MTYRIQVGSGEKKGQWVQRYFDGSFGYYGSFANATPFPSVAAAESALKHREESGVGTSTDWAGDFKIRASTADKDYGTYAWPKIESTPGTYRQQAYHFIGGPKDGVQLILQDGPPEYYFPVASRSNLATRHDRGQSLYSMQTGRAVYLRLPIGVNPTNQQPTQRYTVYVFSHIDGLVSTRPGHKILFEDRVWTITGIAWNSPPMGSRIEARTLPQARLSADPYSLYWDWARDVWVFKSKSTVQVDEVRTVVVA